MSEQREDPLFQGLLPLRAHQGVGPPRRHRARPRWPVPLLSRMVCGASRPGRL